MSFFFTADGRKISNENFNTVSYTPTLSDIKEKFTDTSDSLNLKGNLKMDGYIKASKYLLEDGSEMKTIDKTVEKIVQQNPPYIKDNTDNVEFTKKVVTNKLQLGNKWTLNGDADGLLNDDWLRLMGPDNKSYNGGFAAKKLYATEGGITSEGPLTVHGRAAFVNQLNMNDKSISLRDDQNFHHVAYSQDVDGPRICGYTGGKLTSTKDNKTFVDALKWNGEKVESTLPLTVNGGVALTGNINMAGGTIIATAGRQHIAGDEYMYILNKNGVMLGKEWGGNGSLVAQGNISVYNGMDFNTTLDKTSLTLGDVKGAAYNISTGNYALTFHKNKDDGTWEEAMKIDREKTLNTQNIKNSGYVKTNKIHLGNKWILNGDGDGQYNDNWLRLVSAKDNTNYSGGLAVSHLYADKRMYLNNRELYIDTDNVVKARTPNETKWDA